MPSERAHMIHHPFRLAPLVHFLAAVAVVVEASVDVVGVAAAAVIVAAVEVAVVAEPRSCFAAAGLDGIAEQSLVDNQRFGDRIVVGGADIVGRGKRLVAVVDDEVGAAVERVVVVVGLGWLAWYP